MKFDSQNESYQNTQLKHDDNREKKTNNTMLMHVIRQPAYKNTTSYNRHI